MRDKSRVITVKVTPGLNYLDIGFVQHIEKQIDWVFEQEGFTKTITGKSGGFITLTYEMKERP